jgi:hypothetical protein
LELCIERAGRGKRQFYFSDSITDIIIINYLPILQKSKSTREEITEYFVYVLVLFTANPINTPRSHDGDHEVFRLLRRDGVQRGKSVTSFQWEVVPPLSSYIYSPSTTKTEYRPETSLHSYKT